MSTTSEPASSGQPPADSRKIVFVRHSQPTVVPEQPAAMWTLSASGRISAIELGHVLSTRLGGTAVRVFASAELKAIETAELLGLGPVAVDDRFGEVAKPWYSSPDAHAQAASDYLTGRRVADWEMQDSAVERFRVAVGAIDEERAVVVAHGTVLALFLARRLITLDAPRFWRNLRMPDAFELDMASAELDHVA